MNPKDKRPACCEAAGDAYDEGAIEWRDADPGGNSLLDDLPGQQPPHHEPKTPAEVNANRFWQTARLNEDFGVYRPATSAGYRVVVDWCPETEGNAYPMWGEARFCPFCGEEFGSTERSRADAFEAAVMQRLAKDHEFLHGQAAAAVVRATTLEERLRSTAKRLRDEKGKDANNWPHTTRNACQCGSSGFRGPPTDTCPGCRVRDSILEACAKLLDEVVSV